MADQNDPADDLMSLVQRAVPRPAHSEAAEHQEPSANDASLAETCAGLRMALDSEGSGAIEIVDAELDSLLTGLEEETSPPTTQAPSDSGLIVFADVLAESRSVPEVRCLGEGLVGW